MICTTLTHADCSPPKPLSLDLNESHESSPTTTKQLKLPPTHDGLVYQQAFPQDCSVFLLHFNSSMSRRIHSVLHFFITCREVLKHDEHLSTSIISHVYESAPFVSPADAHFVIQIPANEAASSHNFIRAKTAPTTPPLLQFSNLASYTKTHPKSVRIYRMTTHPMTVAIISVRG